MAFTFADLEAKLPSGTFTQTADDITVSLKALTESASVQLADDTVANAVHDLLEGCAAAQAEYNTANSSSTMNTFASPTYSAPIVRSNGQRQSNATFTVVTTTPLDFSQTEANMS